MRPGFDRTLAQTLAWLLAAPAAFAQADFSDVYPVLQARCVVCHSGPAAPLGLRLDSRDGLLAGSSRGAVVVAGDPAASELIKRIEGASLPRMPMTGPPFLTDDEIAVLEQWILAGMPAGPVPEVPDTGTDEMAVSTSLEAGSGPVSYDRVAPIFAQRCAKCHAQQGVMGPAPEDYRLTSYADTISTFGRVRVVPGNPGASELVRRVRGQARPRMPFDGPPYLAEDEIALIE